jgi:hypothetical protein
MDLMIKQAEFILMVMSIFGQQMGVLRLIFPKIKRIIENATLWYFCQGICLGVSCCNL